MKRQRSSHPAGVLLGLAVTMAALGLAPDPAPAQTHAPARVIVLGMDGLDYAYTQKLMDEGRLPHFAHLRDTGSFQPLETSVPPQSPVAWSNFITGLDSGGHGIFDFIHRDPETLTPYLSTSRTVGAEKTWKIGKYQIPLAGGHVELLRHGKAFWADLTESGIENTVMRMPANFPPSQTATRELSGMGTPDLLGTYGTFSFYTTDADPWKSKEISGGHVYPVRIENGDVHTALAGPKNPFRVDGADLQSPFIIHVDPVDPLVLIEAGDERLVLAEGEWSRWVRVDFDMVPTQKLAGQVRFFVKQVHPELQIYASPVNMDAFDPALPISYPPDFAKYLAEKGGPYYTQGMPEDTKALTEGVLSRDEFLAQAEIAGNEIIEQFPTVLDDYENGLLFYYFGNVDQVSHMMWRVLDPGHPAYDPVEDPKYAEVIPRLYEKMDAVLGYTLDHMPENTLVVVMSDHGFASWRRAFHLNSWLRDNGYLVLKDPDREDPGFLLNVDWSRTRAYGLGLNGLYLNLRGRERFGIVMPSERQALLDELTEKLLRVRDPWNGELAISKVYQSDEIYRDRGHLEIGPDIQIGYAKTWRGSNESALGEIPDEVFMDNTSEWCGDHCMDHEAVPGILLTTRPLQRPAPSLKELGASILVELGVTHDLQIAKDGK